MKLNRILILLTLGLLMVVYAACTPPPPPEDTPDTPDTQTEAPADTETPAGDIETPADETESPAVDETEPVDEAATDTEEGTDSESVDEEEKVDEEPVVDDGSTGISDIAETSSDEFPPDLFGHYETWPPDSITDEEVDHLRHALIFMETNKGTMQIRVYPDAAPLHSANFVKLVQDGFYDGLTFHRVIADFMSQGGDPTGDGSGANAPQYTLPAEIGLPHVAGSIAAARTGDNFNPERRSSPCQFYIVHSDTSGAGLNGAYTVYGQVVEGLDVNLNLSVNYTGRGPITGADTDYIIRAWVERG